jgi:hypothetical protein
MSTTVETIRTATPFLESPGQALPLLEGARRHRVTADATLLFGATKTLIMVRANKAFPRAIAIASRQRNDELVRVAPEGLRAI